MAETVYSVSAIFMLKKLHNLAELSCHIVKFMLNLC